MAVTCKNCGGAHPVWECKKPLKVLGQVEAAVSATPASKTRSTAARKDVRVQPSRRLALQGSYSDERPLPEPPALGANGVVAGTQAPPVDTISEPGSKGSASGREVTLQRPAPKHPGGRPKLITDMKAYKAQKAREYRAKQKAVKNGQ